MKFTVPEGATPIDDISHLRIPGILTVPDLNAAEAENILRAMEKHLYRPKDPKKQWLTDKYIRRLHLDMFDGVWEWAGNYRNSELNIGVSTHLIREEIGKLIQDVYSWNTSTLSYLERAVRLHHRLVWIHPFFNGNGRHARLLSDIYLHSYGQPLPTWPESDLSEHGNVRLDYLDALRAADSGDYAPLVKWTEGLL